MEELLVIMNFKLKVDKNKWFTLKLLLQNQSKKFFIVVSTTLNKKQLQQSKESKQNWEGGKHYYYNITTCKWLQIKLYITATA